MATRKVANPLALAVLTVLRERPMHPYEISTTLKQRHKEESIKVNYGSLYSVMEALEKHGFVTAEAPVSEGRRPARTVYTLTESGLAEAIDWLSELLASPVKEFTRFEAGLSLMAFLPPADVAELLEARLAAREAERQKWLALAATFPKMPRIFLIESEFQGALIAAEVAFVRDLLTEIRDGTFPELHIWQRMHELLASDLTPDERDRQIGEEYPEELGWVEQFNPD